MCVLIISVSEQFYFYFSLVMYFFYSLSICLRFCFSNVFVFSNVSNVYLVFNCVYLLSVSSSMCSYYVSYVSYIYICVYFSSVCVYSLAVCVHVNIYSPSLFSSIFFLFFFFLILGLVTYLSIGIHSFGQNSFRVTGAGGCLNSAALFECSDRNRESGIGNRVSALLGLEGNSDRDSFYFFTIFHGMFVLLFRS